MDESRFASQEEEPEEGEANFRTRDVEVVCDETGRKEGIIIKRVD